MATKQQVKQALELALSLSKSLGALTPEEAREFFEVLGEINKVFSKTVDPEAHAIKAPKGHPVDTLLKKGKVELDERRYQQLVVIYDELTAVNIKFLSAKQNQHVTWFPLIGMEGDKSAALFLSGGGWTVEPMSPKANGELTGEWQGWNLLDHLAANCPDLDLEDY